MRIVKSYIAALVAFLVGDLVWISDSTGWEAGSRRRPSRAASSAW